MLTFIYNCVVLNMVSTLRPLFIALAKGKVAESLRQQGLAIPNLRLKLQKNPVRGPCIWVHVSSAGEFLQARPVIDQIKAQRPDVFVALSFVSTSTLTFVENYKGADLSFFAPLDTVKNTQAVLQLLNPKVLLLVKFDIWPNMITESRKMGAKVILISANLRAHSRRHTSSVLRSFFGQLYLKINSIFVVGPEDQERFLQACPSHPRIQVVGDTRSDSVLLRQAELKARPLSQATQSLDEAKSQTDFILVAGSAWPEDENILLPAWKKIKSIHPKAWLVMVPHEPNAFYLQILEDKLNAQQLSFVRFSDFQASAPLSDVLIMDRVGMLADLYRLGDATYVGAGPGGVHNTMEPAAWSLPVCFRPTFQNAPEAIELVAARTFQVVADSQQAYELIENWIKNKGYAQELGRKGREFLEKSSGATYTCCVEITQEL